MRFVQLAILVAVLVTGWPAANTRVANAAPSGQTAGNASAPGSWTLLNPPLARSQHSASWDPVNAQMLVYGGQGGSRLDDFWAYRPATNSWSEIHATGPKPRALAGHSTIWDPVRNQMLLFGGHGGGTTDLWTYQPTTNVWTPLDPPGLRPPTRGYHSAVWDPASEQMYVFGGIGSSFNVFDDVWAYHPRSNTWLQYSPRGSRPFPRFFAAAAWDPERSQLLVFGGTEPFSGQRLDDLWAFRPVDNAWTELIQADGPPERLSHTAIWDPSLGQMIVFGGSCGAGCFRNDLWAYRPGSNSWEQLPTAGKPPTPRGGHSAVWDSTNRRILFFAGSQPKGPANDFWSYQPGTYAWSLLDSDRPTVSAIGSHRAVWDPQTEQLLVFDSTMERLWSYRGDRETWSEVSPGGTRPAAREDPSAVWDQARGQMLVFGGYGADGYLNEFWSYRTASNAWARLTPGGSPPPGRLRHTAVWDPDGERMLVFGGYGLRLLEDLWSYSARSNTWEQLAPSGPAPLSRQEHVAVWDPAGARMLVYGGGRGDALADLWEFTAATNSWRQHTPSGERPRGRFAHTGVWDPISAQLLVFGGVGTPEADEMWVYRANDNQWRRQIGSAVPLPGRGHHSAAWDTASGRALVVSGYRDSRPVDLWSYRSANAAWSKPDATRAAPSARQSHTMVWNTAGRYGLLFGGTLGASEALDDLWTFRPASRSWHQLATNGPTPPAVSGHAAAWEGAGQRMLIYGGTGPAGALRDVWAYTAAANSWERIEAVGVTPPDRDEHSAVWDTANRRLLVYGGGHDGRPFDDLWSFDPATRAWTQVMADGTGPEPRFRHTAIWDPVGEQMLVFGGYGGAFPGGYMNELWSYRPETNQWTRLAGGQAASAPGSQPAPRARHAMVWDPEGRRLFVMGGFAGGIDYLGDLWSYDVVADGWKQLVSPGPTPRAALAALWDGSRLVLFGGYGGGLLGELWSYQP